MVRCRPGCPVSRRLRNRVGLPDEGRGARSHATQHSARPGHLAPTPGELESAARALVRAIDLDPDYAEAFNSLAITQKRMTQFDKALHNYDAGRKALSRRHVKQMRNDVRKPVIKLHDPVGTKWLECATFGALWSASEAGPQASVGPQVRRRSRRTLRRRTAAYTSSISQPVRASFALFFPTFSGASSAGCKWSRYSATSSATRDRSGNC